MGASCLPREAAFLQAVEQLALLEADVGDQKLAQSMVGGPIALPVQHLGELLLDLAMLGLHLLELRRQDGIIVTLPPRLSPKGLLGGEMRGQFVSMTDQLLPQLGIRFAPLQPTCDLERLVMLARQGLEGFVAMHRGLLPRGWYWPTRICILFAYYKRPAIRLIDGPPPRMDAMQLNQQTDFAFRLLMYLADHAARHNARGANAEETIALPKIREIADYFEISYNHLMKVANALAARGYVKARRGKGGGLALARAESSISLGAVARDMEGHWELVECFSTTGDCRIAASCRLAPVLGEALEAFWAVLDRYTLADIAHLPPGDLPLTFHRHGPPTTQ